MNKKSLLGLILFAGLITTGLFVSADYLINHSNTVKEQTTDGNTKIEATDEGTTIVSGEDADNPVHVTPVPVGAASQGDNDITVSKAPTSNNASTAVDIVTAEPWLSSNPSDVGAVLTQPPVSPNPTENPTPIENPEESTASLSTKEDGATPSVSTVAGPKLIIDSNSVDYEAYIPKMVKDSQLKKALDISNPSISIDAKAAILFDADTKEILYYKNPVEAVFPASTAKLLTSIVALEWCTQEEEVTIGNEVKMIASDSTKAGLRKGEVLTIRNLLEGMLLPSGNDAAYAVAAYVGRKSLQNPGATKEEALAEFVRLMNNKAKELGVKNSCFKTPDGYDAIGQYTTAYDMGLIGIAASYNETILEVAKLSTSRNFFVSGEDVTWNSTNKLITKYSGQYYSHAIGLKTGTSTMAGRCLIAAGEYNGKKVVCAIMDSTSAGRWEDAIALLKYGLNN